MKCALRLNCQLRRSVNPTTGSLSPQKREEGAILLVCNQKVALAV
jgi:hypothetical protein